jgi:hypothetical protein
MSNWTTKASPISGEYWEVRDEDGGIAADMIPDEAIARLVAAAPELLDALKSAAALLSDPEEDDISADYSGRASAVLSQVQTAISKAEGGE